MCDFCITLFSWVWKEIVVAVWDWAKRTVELCWKRKCKWWCLCCNKWFCWVFVIFVLVVTYTLTFVLVLVPTVICGICFPLCWIVCGLACALNKLFGRPAPQSCLDCWDICTGAQSPGSVGGTPGSGPLGGGGGGVTTGGTGRLSG